MLVINIYNYKDSKSLKELKYKLEFNRKNGLHLENHLILSEIFQSILNTIYLFGDKDFNKRILSHFITLIRSRCINEHSKQIDYINLVEQLKNEWLKDKFDNTNDLINLTSDFVYAVRLN